MPRTKTGPAKTILTTLRLSPQDDAALRFVADELRIDMSSTLRFLVHEKRRELELAIERRRRLSSASGEAKSSP